MQGSPFTRWPRHIPIGGSAWGATFGFTVPMPDRVRLELYDARERLLAARPFEAIATGGVHAIRWEPASLSAGTYVVGLATESGHTAQTKWTFLR